VIIELQCQIIVVVDIELTHWSWQLTEYIEWQWHLTLRCINPWKTRSR